MKSRNVVPMKIAKYGYMTLSILFCLAGLAMIVFPKPSLTTIGKLFGYSMIIFGIIKAIGYYSKDLYRLAFQYDFEFGIAFTLLGIVALVNPGNIMNFICISLGICEFFDCLFKIRIALQGRDFGILGWKITMILAIISGILSLLLVLHPTEAMNIMIDILGLSLIFNGILNLDVAIDFVKIVHNQRPDVIDIDYETV